MFEQQLADILIPDLQKVKSLNDPNHRSTLAAPMFKNSKTSNANAVASFLSKPDSKVSDSVVEFDVGRGTSIKKVGHNPGEELMNRGSTFG